MNIIPVNLVVEDFLSEAVLRRLLENSNQPFAVGACYCHGGFGYIKSKIMGFNHAAKGTPFLVLTDLDQAECPPAMLKEWFWWQIEATVETLDDESSISLSDMTICFWIALVLTGCINFS